MDPRIEPDPALIAASRRAWRIALVAYLVPLTVATHWPRLGFGEGGMIDKFIHFAGFGLLAWMWMHAAPRGSALLGFAIGFGWVYLDERTQAIEILGRTFSVLDMVAGWLGVLMAGAVFALRHPALRAGEARREMLEQEAMLYARGASWTSAAGTVLLAVFVVGGGMLGRMRVAGDEINLAAIVYCAGFALVVGLVLATALGMRLGRFRWERANGRRSMAHAFAPWSWPLALAFGTGLFFGYRALVRAMFAGDAGAEPSFDHQGYLILEQGFMVVAALVAILAADALAWRGRGDARASMA
ncbi:MAG: hypothetical protein ACKOYN_04560 [Planctomycetota bacterium]